MKKAILYDIMIENDMCIEEDFEEIRERALNAAPSILPSSENVIELLEHIETHANDFSKEEYQMLFEKGFDNYIETVSPYIYCYLSKEDLRKIELLNEWGVGNTKEQIKRLYFNAFIIARFKIIKVDYDLFESYAYFNRQNNQILEQEILEKWKKKIDSIKLEDKKIHRILSCGLETFLNKNNNPGISKKEILYTLSKKYSRTTRTIERDLQQIEILEKEFNLPPISQYIRQK